MGEGEAQHAMGRVHAHGRQQANGVEIAAPGHDLVAGEAGSPDGALALFLLPPFEGEDLSAVAEPILTPTLGLDLLILVLAWLAVRVAVRR